MTDDDFIAALDLPSTFPQLGQPNDPKQNKEQDTHMSKHTPGPWVAGEISWESGWIEINATAPRPMPVAYALPAGTEDRNDDVTIANARLIAAAPELLDACEACLARDDIADDELGVMLRAAIAKARGEA